MRASTLFRWITRPPVLLSRPCPILDWEPQPSQKQACLIKGDGILVMHPEIQLETDQNNGGQQASLLTIYM